MNINIPDRIPKLLVGIGVALFIYGIYLVNISWDRYEKSFSEYQNQLYEVKQLELLINKDLQKLFTESDDLSKKYDVEAQIYQNDSLIFFNKTLNGKENDLLITKILSPKWEKYLDDKFSLDQAKLILEQKKINLESEIEYQENLSKKEIVPVGILSVFFFLVGCFMWHTEDAEKKDSLLIKQNEKIYQRCQSCGEKFSSIKLYGTNNDGTLNLGLCNTCYKEGEFINLNFSEEEFENYVENKIASLKGNKKEKYRKMFKSLERWKKDL